MNFDFDVYSRYLVYLGKHKRICSLRMFNKLCKGEGNFFWYHTGDVAVSDNLWQRGKKLADVIYEWYLIKQGA